MRYWKIIFDDGVNHDIDGWLEIEDGVDTHVKLDDGTEITTGVSYTTIDVNPTPPSWGIV